MKLDSRFVKIQPHVVKIEPHLVKIEPHLVKLESHLMKVDARDNDVDRRAVGSYPYLASPTWGPEEAAMAARKTMKPAKTLTKPAKKKAVPMPRAAAAKAPSKEPAPTADQLCQLLGVTLVDVLEPAQIQRLRRPLPGYASQLDDAAAALATDAKLLALKDLTPARLLAVKERVAHLSDREAVVQRVARNLYEQRMVADDEAIGMLQKLARRVEAVSEDYPELLDRWRFLRDFLATFRATGPRTRAPDIVPLTTPGK